VASANLTRGAARATTFKKSQQKDCCEWYSKLKPLDVGAMKLKVKKKNICFYLTQN